MGMDRSNSRVLAIENLTFGYHAERLLYQNFNLQLNRGEVVAITGASGSGKSTLFELITGNLKPSSGRVHAGKIAQVFQDPYSSFHPSYSVINQIEDVCRFTQDELDSMLTRLNLTHELIAQRPYRLSGGQLQRCSILRALLMRPDIILADEPTSALDNVTQLDVMKLLVSLLDEVGIVLITHDDNLAQWASDTIIDIGEASRTAP
jgi:peptide/nickel transport system ATP-binding protein